MTTEKNKQILWDNGIEKLYTVSVDSDHKYKYTEGKPCITIGFVYESPLFKGYDYFTFFDQRYLDLLRSVQSVILSHNGTFRLYDMGADTDGYIEGVVNNGKVDVSGQLGASFSDHSLKFSLFADQTLLSTLVDCITIEL